MYWKRIEIVLSLSLWAFLFSAGCSPSGRQTESEKQPPQTNRVDQQRAARQQLKAVGIDLDTLNGLAALKRAVETDDVELLKMFFGTEITPQSKYSELQISAPEEPWEKAETIFMYAARLGKLHSLELMLRQGAVVDDGDRLGRTALMRAAAAGQMEALRMLLNHNASINAKDHRDMTALLYAADNRQMETVKFLALAGADVNAKDWRGRNAAFLAKKRFRDDIVAALVAAGSRQPSEEPLFRVEPETFDYGTVKHGDPSHVTKFTVYGTFDHDEEFEVGTLNPFILSGYSSPRMNRSSPAEVEILISPIQPPGVYQEVLHFYSADRSFEVKVPVKVQIVSE